ncbi:DASS family sodium-coupled anion symporter [Fulvivirga sp. M361]|uniref:SLC13 family permease n=1 Tax=Fulvivirga sp. M361 TaxID=2594266 RepID=UPI00117AAB08|nr:DASS family sodium-coupled anion symporter [Fulvivirga sp. M361]TRX52023.1 DASS family sodium-coupled anion symporter [Fulvivirga sp. M361]
MSKSISSTKVIGFFLGPALFGLLLLIGEPPNENIWKVMALALWMVTWWVTDAAPIPVTALLPLVLLPYLGIFSVGESTAPYASPIIFLFMGGFMIALGLEKHNLHQRIALNLIRFTGTSGNGIILGFMLATALLSMWISNTATAVMMLPIATSVIQLLLGDQEMNKSNKRFALGLMLSIAYSANIGGTMTIIGTPPNVVMTGYLKEFADFEMAFAEWLIIGIPAGTIILTCTYFLITKVLFANGIREIEGSDQLIREKLTSLGSFSKEEKLVTMVFLLTALCWIFKQNINAAFGAPVLSDATTAMAGGILMFVTPVNFKKNQFLMKWEDTIKLPWGILILFGGGMCLAKGMEKSGVIQLIGQYVADNSDLGLLSLIAIVTALVLFMTELMSNVALVTIFIPVIIGVANGLDINPLYLVIPATIASSCAFMMPISTPPNAIVFASGHIKIKDMVRAGAILNVLGIIILVIIGKVLVPLVF